MPLSAPVVLHSLHRKALHRSAPIAIVKYGDYECGECKRLSDVLSRVLNDEAHTINYVFRHLPLGSSDHRRAIAAEAAAQQGKFWEMHQALFRHASDHESDVIKAAEEAGLDLERFAGDPAAERIREAVEKEIEEAKSLGVSRLPTLLIGGKEYNGAWDIESVREAIRPPVAKRVKDLAVDFAAWAAARGAVLLLFAAIALLWRNSFFGDAYQQLWHLEMGLGGAGRSLTMSLHHWVNDLLMAIFFLVVGLELKREMFCGELSDLRRAAFPAAAALGGMVVPAAIYLVFNWGTNQAAGWGVPMATDIAFALGVLALLGDRVPTSMRVFATALAIVDDIGAIFVLAFAYNHGLHWPALGATAVLLLVLIGFNRARVYALWPYLAIGLLLWLAVYFSGLHATLAGVLLATTIPTRKKRPSIPCSPNSRWMSIRPAGECATTKGMNRRNCNGSQIAFKSSTVVYIRRLKDWSTCCNLGPHISCYRSSRSPMQGLR